MLFAKNIPGTMGKIVEIQRQSLGDLWPQLSSQYAEEFEIATKAVSRYEEIYVPVRDEISKFFRAGQLEKALQVQERLNEPEVRETLLDMTESLWIVYQLFLNSGANETILKY